MKEVIYIAGFSESYLSARGDEHGFLQRLRQAVSRTEGHELANSPEYADIVVISEGWRNRDWRDINYIESCQFIRTYAQRLLVISSKDIAAPFFPGLYASLTSRNNWTDWTVPVGYKFRYPTRDLPTLEPGGVSPHLLFSFRGGISSHSVRMELVRRFSGYSDTYRFTIVNKQPGTHSAADREAFVKEIISSHFVLAPRGRSPTTFRLFEAMENGRCPVIISDDWQPPEGIDWEKCSIRIKERDIARLPDILAARLSDAAALGAAARRIWLENFDDGVREQRMLEVLLELHRSCVRQRDIDSLSRLWRSRDFQLAQGWSVGRKLKAGLIQYRDRFFR